MPETGVYMGIPVYPRNVPSTRQQKQSYASFEDCLLHIFSRHVAGDAETALGCTVQDMIRWLLPATGHSSQKAAARLLVATGYSWNWQLAVGTIQKKYEFLTKKWPESHYSSFSGHASQFWTLNQGTNSVLLFEVHLHWEYHWLCTVQV